MRWNEGSQAAISPYEMAVCTLLGGVFFGKSSDNALSKNVCSLDIMLLGLCQFSGLLLCWCNDLFLERG